MKIILNLFCLIFLANTIHAQSKAGEVSAKIAQKMKDSLQLTEGQREQIYRINMQIAEEKAAVRTRYAGSDSLRLKIQTVENSRDGLYSTVLSAEKYQLYLRKKTSIVNNN